MSNDGENIKMMAKYNLYVGANWNKVVLNNAYYKNNYYYFEGEKVSGYYYEFSNLISNKLNLVYSSDYYWLNKKNKGIYGYWVAYEDKTKVYTYENINEDTEGYALQNEKALGVTGEQGNANYPIIATTLLYDFGFYINQNSINNFENGYTNFELEENKINENYSSHSALKYLKVYQSKMNEMGYEITNTDIITIDELNELVKNITDNELPLSEWYENSDNDNYSDEYGYTLGDLKEYLSKDYSWIWNTTYWTNTLYGNYKDLYQLDSDLQYYLISSQGEICYDRSSCAGSIPRAGIRPVVTMSSDQVYYVYTKTDGNGEITYERNEDGTVTFELIPNEGYILDSIKVTDSNNNIIKFTDYTFTMPDSDVTIETTFKKKTILNVVDNPNTSTREDIILLITITISLIVLTTYLRIKKYHKSKYING